MTDITYFETLALPNGCGRAEEDQNRYCILDWRSFASYPREAAGLVSRPELLDRQRLRTEVRKERPAVPLYLDPYPLRLED